MAKVQKCAAPTGQLRIIGGRFRGRRLPILTEPGLRPTIERSRETLFNWLAPIVDGSRCLDCFAGSGALGLEAASRGAAQVLMVEHSGPVARQLRRNTALLGADEVAVIDADVIAWLAEQSAQQFDIVFLDPPFGRGLLTLAFDLLRTGGWVAAGTRVYLETAVAEGYPPLPPDWTLVRDKCAGQVRYGMVVVGDAGHGDGALGY
ncbi:MAG: 16S rRNA (guanine(966)-N(2))-methyltransferase RsmD [Thiohalocapsa sp.]